LVYAADTLRDLLLAAWSLTGEMEEEGGATATQTEKVHFFAYPEQPGQELTKTVSVVKINAEGDENVFAHPQFNEVTDTYEITARYRATDIQMSSRDTSESNMEDICAEIVRILKVTYNPSTSTGAYYKARRDWTNMDKPESVQPELIRRLRFTLTNITSDTATVFHSGFGGVLVFDISASGGDSKPGGDFTYTEAYNVDIDEGSNQIGLMTRLSSSKTGKQEFFRGKFQGTYRAELMAKKEDMDNSTIESLDNIYKAQSNGELADVVFLNGTPNTEGSPVTLTTSVKMKVINMRIGTRAEDLVRITMTGRIIQPSTWTVA